MRIYVDEMSGKVSLKEKKITKYADIDFAKLKEEKKQEIIDIWTNLDLLLQGKDLPAAISALMSCVCWQLWSRGISESDATALFCQSYRSGSESWEKTHDQISVEEQEGHAQSFQRKSIRMKKLAVTIEEC